jgi:hypothetical protein
MHSIWTRLLFLHGHVAHKDLAWGPDAQRDAQRRKSTPFAKPQRTLLARCAAVWPRLMGPR